jgi:hypothetical protein
MTTNAFIFSWDHHGIEGIIPITQYEHWDKQNLIRILKEERTQKNPLDHIVRNLILRAQFNSQRHYEIYAIDCDSTLDEQFWRRQWEEYPQETADLIRQRGHKLFSNRNTTENIRVK